VPFARIRYYRGGCFAFCVFGQASAGNGTALARLVCHECILERSEQRSGARGLPFRDGTISVTFAEIAIWQKSPNTQFQLLRKSPPSRPV
jgi:hypothetical protein